MHRQSRVTSFLAKSGHVSHTDNELEVGAPSTQVGKSASMHVCKYAGAQVYIYADIQICRYAGMQECRLGGVQACTDSESAVGAARRGVVALLVELSL